MTQIMAGLAFPDRRFLDLFGGPNVMIESPILDEVKEILRNRNEVEFSRRAVVKALAFRFGSVPADLMATLAAVDDAGRLWSLQDVAMSCPDLAAFVAEMKNPSS